IFCDDLLDRLHKDSATPAAVCVSILDRWRDLFNPKAGRLLSEQALVGLLAELHVLERIAGRASGAAALRLWTGPDKARADFTGSLASLDFRSFAVDRMA
ncbi:MAG: PD-(D/E)XK motif protein, partial [Trebonia sp.]